MPFAATWMDREIIILSEISQTEKDKNHMILLILEFKHMIQMNLFTKQKQTHRHGKQTYGYQREQGRGGINQEFGIKIYTQLFME